MPRAAAPTTTQPDRRGLGIDWALEATLAGIFDTPTQEAVAAALARRAEVRMRAMSEDALYAYLSEAVYLERRRFGGGDEPGPMELDALEGVARALVQGRDAAARAALELVRHYVYEVHNRFSPRTYGFATKVLPGLLTLVLGTRPSEKLLHADFDPANRVLVHGPLDRLAKLAKTHTLIIAPTHVSNMDSPLLGYALYAAGLPPVVYGAGLNLFSNPAMSFFMSRLGAYTVDRRKKHGLYKDVLKDYSIEAISRRCHSLFFPGGTRSRSGRIERNIKKGLLGTGLQAWQEGVAAGRPDPGVLVVPCNLSSSLVLEAETLIEDSLAEEGKSRYIISDDEFSEPRVVASFLSSVISLDASVHVRFGVPLDVLGNPVDEDGHSVDRTGEKIERLRYISDADGQIETDPQRDRVYTAQLAAALETAYKRGNTVLATNLVAFCAWNLLGVKNPRANVYQRALLSSPERLLDARAVLASVERVYNRVMALADKGELHQALPSGPTAILDEALARFASFHSVPGLRYQGADLLADAKLCLYYGNRLVGYGLEKVAIAAPASAESGGVS